MNKIATAIFSILFLATPKSMLGFNFQKESKPPIEPKTITFTVEVTPEMDEVEIVKTNTTTVKAGGTDVYREIFVGGQKCKAIVEGDGDTDLDLYVYDENDNLIVKDDDNTDYCVCEWQPRWSGQFVIRVKNLGRVYNRYTITLRGVQ